MVSTIVILQMLAIKILVDRESHIPLPGRRIRWESFLMVSLTRYLQNVPTDIGM